MLRLGLIWLLAALRVCRCAETMGGRRHPRTPPALLDRRLAAFCVGALQAVVSIVSLILNNNWAFVWMVTGIAGLVVLSAPQISESLGAWRAKKAGQARG